MLDGRGVRVAVQNVWAHFGRWEERRAVLIDGLRALDPDLVALIEPIERDGYDQTVDLLGPGYHVVYQEHRDESGVGASIASRWPLANVEEVSHDVTVRTSDWIGVSLIAEIRAPDPLGPILFVNSNPSWQRGRERERELQAVAMARRIEEIVIDGPRHVILAGDFDAEPDAASIRFLTGRQSLDEISVCYRDAWQLVHGTDPGYTFTPRNSLVAEGDVAWDIDRRIDYIFVRCDDRGPTLDIRSCTRLFDTPVDGIWASDHFGVAADLALPNVVRPFHH
jgi:endonuclease/exonuclease/phosphatase family metal-dependent hydrolase